MRPDCVNPGRQRAGFDLGNPFLQAYVENGPPHSSYRYGPHFAGPQQRRFRMNYVDGFVAAVPTANREKYLQHAQKAAVAFKEYGALQVVETWGNDVPEGKVTSFTMAVQRKDDESVVFSWVTWPSKAVRDDAWKKMMEDPRFNPETNPMPFDGKRLIYGGFEMILNA
jgi:uncharacterized protein YbaA (DUF1428 family)